MRTLNKLVVASLLSTTLIASGAFAITQSVTANVSFITPLTITNYTPISFAKLSAGVAATTYVLSTAGAVTPTGGGAVEFGTPAAGSMLIKGSATQQISITAGSYATGGTTATVTASAATCKYGAAAEAACTAIGTVAAPTSAGTTLLVGATISVPANMVETSSAPTFVVTVSYM
jgi:hypothetical protein